MINVKGDQSGKFGNLDKVLSREIPSQVPVTVTKASYHRMLTHCTTMGGVWACKKNGARIMAKMVKMTVWDRETKKIDRTNIPVVHLYCSGCDKAPNVVGQDAIFKHKLMTVTM